MFIVERSVLRLHREASRQARGTAIVNLNNKSNTEDYEKQVKAFLNLVSEKYSPAVEKLLAHDESALGPDGIQSIIDKAELAEKKNRG